MILRKVILNFALILCSVLAALAGTEVLMRALIDKLPRSAFNLFSRELQVLGQTSKTELLPRTPYIAIAGDSYGVGKGDWFTNLKYDRNARYQATHLIQDALGIDVISLSRAGAGNYEGLALHSRNTVKVLRRFGFELPPPQFLVVYFYEGNDISDNLNFMKRYYLPDYSEDRIFDDEYFSAFSTEMDKRFCKGYVREFEGNYLVLKGIGSAFESIKNRLRTEVNDQPYGAVKARIAGKIVPMQNDVLDLEILDFEEKQIREGLRFFERALAQSLDTWGEVTRIVLYIPSPISSYHTLEPLVDKLRRERSADISSRVRAAAEKHGFKFYSAAPAIRAAAEARQVHGPWDWSHLNRDGYGVLAQEIVKAYRKELG